MDETNATSDQAVQPVTEETPQFKNIFIHDVNCRGAFQGILLQGLPEMNLENVQLEKIQMEADYGLVCKDTKNVKIKDLTMKTRKLPVIDMKNSKDVTIDGLITQATEAAFIQISGTQAGKTVFRNVGVTNFEKQVIIGKEVPKNVVQLVK
jgi:hypothetical protein